MRRWRRLEVRGISEFLGKGMAYITKAIAWVIGYAGNKLFNIGRHRDEYDDGVILNYSEFADRAFDISYVVYEFVWRILLWFLVNVVGAMLFGVIVYFVGTICLFFGIVFGAIFSGPDTIVEEYYYYH